MRFLRDADYNLQAREEILNFLDYSDDQATILQAEAVAISQMKKRLSKRFNTDQIFTPWDGTGTDTRDPYVVLTVIDIVLYHLWTAHAPGKIPATRKERYQDALDWIKEEGSGTNPNGDLPGKTEEEYKPEFRLVSKAPENHKW